MTWAPGEHVIPLNPRGDALRIQVWHNANAFELEGFSIQLVAIIDGRYYPVARYDTSHGSAPHRDVLNWDGSTYSKTPMRGGISLNEAFDEAFDDLEHNLNRYVEDFLRRRP